MIDRERAQTAAERDRTNAAIGAVSASPHTHRPGLYFASPIDGYFGAGEAVGFLLNLLRSLPGKVIVMWDGGSNHKGPIVRSFLARNRRLWRERLPPYAPELNPVEQVWGWLDSDHVSVVLIE